MCGHAEMAGTSLLTPYTNTRAKIVGSQILAGPGPLAYGPMGLGRGPSSHSITMVTWVW